MCIRFETVSSRMEDYPKIGAYHCTPDNKTGEAYSCNRSNLQENADLVSKRIKMKSKTPFHILGKFF